jgi:putative molybdopterin biosynthesis protein
MYPIRHLDSFQHLKLLADPRRLKILKRLMEGSASLTILGKELGEHPAWIRHHLLQLEAAGMVELVETRVQSGVVEKFFRAKAGGYQVQELIIPNDPSHPSIIFSGSHDLAIELLADILSPHFHLLYMPVGSLDGLMTLRGNIAHISGCHLLDETGEYNLPFIRHIFPDREMEVITLAYREQGMMTAPGNPKSICAIADLANNDVTFANRNPGSGTRLWLDQNLIKFHIPANQINGYSTSYHTHTECARLISEGLVDASIGLRAAAHSFNLSFVPLFHERYDLVFPAQLSIAISPLLDTVQTTGFRHKMDNLVGYETIHTGEKLIL